MPQLFTGQVNLRYLLPAAPLLALSAGLAVDSIRWRSVRTLAGAALALTWGFASLSEWRVVLSQRPLEYLSTRERAARWLARTGWNGAVAMPKLSLWAHEAAAESALSPSDTIHMIGESKGRLLPCRYLPDESFIAFRLWGDLARNGGDVDSLRQELLSREIRLVLLNRGYLEWVALATSAGANPGAAVHATRRLLAGGEVLYDSDGVTLVRLREN